MAADVTCSDYDILYITAWVLCKICKYVTFSAISSVSNNDIVVFLLPFCNLYSAFKVLTIIVSQCNLHLTLCVFYTYTLGEYPTVSINSTVHFAFFGNIFPDVRYV